MEEIYKALGWQGSTVHQVAAEIKRLKANQAALLDASKAFRSYYTLNGENKSLEYLKMLRLNLKQAIVRCEAVHNV